MNNKVIYVIILAMLMMSCGGEQEIKAPDKLVKSLVVHKHAAGTIRYFPGRIQAKDTAMLSFEVPGTLMTLDVEEGDTIHKGGMLARIDPETYQNKSDEAHSRYLLEKTQYERGLRLKKKDYISQAEMDILYSKYKIAESNLKIAEHNLEETTIYAPFHGLVSKKHVKNFEYVNAKDKVMTFHDLSIIKIEIHIPEDIIAKLKHGDKPKPVAIFRNIEGKIFDTKVEAFSSEADPDTQTYLTTLEMTPPDEIHVFPGMSVSIQVNIPDRVQGKMDYYLIPAGAVFVDNADQSYVWKIDANNLEIQQVPISISTMTGNSIKVVSGIHDGDRIVVAGVSFLKEGDKVRLRDEDQ